MADLSTLTTLPSELTLNARIGTIGLVVSNLATVEALTGRAASFLTLLRAIASEVSLCATANAKSVTMESVNG
jgi:hypothetical protein